MADVLDCTPSEKVASDMGCSRQDARKALDQGIVPYPGATPSPMATAAIARPPPVEGFTSTNHYAEVELRITLTDPPKDRKVAGKTVKLAHPSPNEIAVSVGGKEVLRHRLFAAVDTDESNWCWPVSTQTAFHSLPAPALNAIGSCLVTLSRR